MKNMSVPKPLKEETGMNISSEEKRYKSVSDYKYKLNVLANVYVELYGCENRFANGVISGLRAAANLADELIDAIPEEEEDDDVVFGDDLVRVEDHTIHFVISKHKHDDCDIDLSDVLEGIDDILKDVNKSDRKAGHK